MEWVLTLPPRLRYLLAWDHDLCRAVVAVYLRAVLGWLRRQARRRGVMDGRGGAVAFVQRFDAALNLNVHIHAFVLDGVFTPDCSGGVSVRAHERHDSGVSVFAPRRWTRCARADKQRQAFSRQALLRTMQNSAPAAGPRH